MQYQSLQYGLLALLLAVPGAVSANPVNATVVNGAALISNPSASVLQIINTPGTIINWDSFSISNGETTRFVQESALSAVLNRVTGSSPSDILGTLRSNGRVFLINPNGIVFGGSAVVDVAGLIASTRDISNADFLAGNFRFSGTGSGAITLQSGAQIGTATAGNGGQVWLFAKNITQVAGSSITAPEGEVALAAGTELTVAQSNLGNMVFNLTTDGANTVQTLGSIAASRGAVGLFADSIIHSGTVDAGTSGLVAMNATADLTLKDGSTTTAPDGNITLRGGAKLEVEYAANVTADGANGSISFESNNLLVSPSGNTHAVNGRVTFNQYQPSQYTLDTRTALGAMENGIGFRNNDGSLVFRWWRWATAALTDFAFFEARFDRNGTFLSGPTAIGILTGDQYGALVVPQYHGNGYQLLMDSLAQGRTDYVALAAIYRQPTADGGWLLGPYPVQSFASNGALRGQVPLCSAPLADGTIANPTAYSQNGKIYTTTGVNVQIGSFSTEAFYTPDATLATVSGGFLTLGSQIPGSGAGGLDGVAVRWVKAVPPYTPANSLTGMSGMVPAMATAPGASLQDSALPPPPSSPLPPPYVTGTGSGAKIDCSGTGLCPTGVKEAMAILGTSLAEKFFAEGGDSALRNAVKTKEAVDTLRAGQAARSNPGVAQKEAKIVIKVYSDQEKFMQDALKEIEETQKTNPGAYNKVVEAKAAQVQKFVQQEILLEQLDVNRTDPNSMSVATAIVSMSDEEKAAFFDAWTKFQEAEKKAPGMNWKYKP